MKKIFFSLILSCSLISTALSMEPKKWFCDNKSEIMEYSKSLALGAGVSYFNNISRNKRPSPAFALSIVLTIMATYDIFGAADGKALKKCMALLLGGLLCEKIILKIN